MIDREIQLIIGSLLHDIGKVIYREGGDVRKHSQSGYDYLRDEAKITSPEILHCVRYHHGDALSAADISQDDLAYIVYIADNIAAAADRRKTDREDAGFEKTMPLQSVFNILKGNHQEFYYRPGMLKAGTGISFPQKEKIPFDASFYSQVMHEITDNLKNLDWSAEYVNSLLEVLEATLSYVPSSTAKDELADISLYDHVKMTAAIACCIYCYLQEKGYSDYRKVLLKEAENFYHQEVFLLFSMDISGIQDFIYTIVPEHALKTLRARSFYLEIMMEHMIDCLLEKLELSRANLLYCGGGHAYFLLPNTGKAREEVDQFLEDQKHWFLKHFKTALYIAGGYAACSSRTLQNKPEGSYSKLFRMVGAAISEKKSRRYPAEDIIKLNHSSVSDYSRECKVCKNLAPVNENGLCAVCEQIEKLSQKILYSEFFTVLKGEDEDKLPLPENDSLVSDDADSLKRRMESDAYFVRSYGKNKQFTGKHIASKIWVGDYTIGQSFQELASQAKGIDRIGILRADVDNLGETFVSGFENRENNSRYVTISRTAALSRQLSLFFKHHINWILSHPEFSLDGSEKKKCRSAVIIYSGGDDVFLAGAWNEVIELAVDLRRNLERYTQGTLTISAGIGIYPDKYPIHAIAEEVGRMEEESKHLPGKNAVTLLEDGKEHDEPGTERKISDGTYPWKVFEEDVLGEKYRVIQEFFDKTEDRGNSFLYRLLELIRNQKEKINFARYVYLLARLEPMSTENIEKKEAYQKFSSCMYKWIQSEKDCRQLKTAIQLYVYGSRTKEGD